MGLCPESSFGWVQNAQMQFPSPKWLHFFFFQFPQYFRTDKLVLSRPTLWIILGTASPGEKFAGCLNFHPRLKHRIAVFHLHRLSDLSAIHMAPLWIFVALGYLLLYALASVQAQWLDCASNRITGWYWCEAVSRLDWILRTITHSDRRSRFGTVLYVLKTLQNQEFCRVVDIRLWIMTQLSSMIPKINIDPAWLCLLSTQLVSPYLNWPVRTINL